MLIPFPVQLYTVEKAKAKSLQEARGNLENELDDIARELSNVRIPNSELFELLSS